MKKVISVFLTMALVLTNFQGWNCLKQLELSKKFNLFQGIEQSFAQKIGTPLEGSGLYYTISDNEVTITDVESYEYGTHKNLVIPETIEGYPVTSIGDNAFSECIALRSISIPESVTSIGNSAFVGCTSLKSINIPEKVIFIGRAAFAGCESLSTINIPKGITFIEENLFYGCESLESINIPEGVKSIGKWAFACTSLTSITIPTGVENIEEFAFASCGSLTNITIPEGVTSIGDCAFNSCTSLISINVNDENKNYCSIDGVLFDKNIKTIILYPSGKLGENYNIPKGVTTIKKHAFDGCKLLTKISIPEGVTDIGIAAFEYCSSLTDISIPEGINSIEEATFKGCKSLRSITIPNGVKTIGRAAFENCISLTDINMSEDLTTIDEFAFSECNALKNITIQKGVTTVKKAAFNKCRSLTSINVSDKNKNYCSVDGILFEKNMKKIVAYPSGKLDQNYVIPEEVTSIEDYAFYDCKSLRSVTIPRGVTSIGNSSFYNITIYGYLGSYAEQYAREYYLKFEPITISLYSSNIKISDVEDQIYTGRQIKPAIEVKDGDTLLIEGVDYTVKYGENVSEQGSIVVTGINNYEASRTIKFAIINKIQVPNDIKANSKSYNSITVKWNEVGSVDGYQVYRATSKNGTYSLRKTVESGSTLSYTNTKLTTGKTYYYKVRAYKIVDGKKVYSEFSKVVSAKPIPATPIVTATSKSYNSNRVKWSKVTGASGYQVYRATSKNGTYSLRKTVTSGSMLNYTNTGLTTGKTYYYKVRAYRTVNGKRVYGQFSEIVSAKPIPATPVVTLTSKSKKVTVKWSKVTGASGYQVYRATSENGTYSLKKTVTSGSTLSYTNTGLTTGKSYYYKVRAYKIVNGKKIYSNYSSIKSIQCK